MIDMLPWLLTFAACETTADPILLRGRVGQAGDDDTTRLGAARAALHALLLAATAVFFPMAVQRPVQVTHYGHRHPRSLGTGNGLDSYVRGRICGV